MMINSIPSSPEFEFWSVIRNPAQPYPTTRILSADELFSGGVLLPLDRLSLRSPNDPPDDREGTGSPGSSRLQDAASPVVTTTEPESTPTGPQLASSAEPASSSKRWRDIFKKSEKKSPLPDHQVEDLCNRGKGKENNKEKLEKEKRKNKRTRGGSGSSPELNINIWPFSRSRSAGNGTTRPGNPLGAPPTRRVSSTPCSRSNSAGESKSRTTNGYRWPSSPGRARVHVGRSSPVWQPRRVGTSASGSRISTSIEPVVPISWQGGRRGRSNKKDSIKTKARVLNVNVPTCIVSRANLVCRSEAGSGATSRAGGGGGDHGGSLFSLRGLFTKKVH